MYTYAYFGASCGPLCALAQCRAVTASDLFLLPRAADAAAADTAAPASARRRTPPTSREHNIRTSSRPAVVRKRNRPKHADSVLPHFRVDWYK